MQGCGAMEIPQVGVWGRGGYPQVGVWGRKRGGYPRWAYGAVGMPLG